MESNKIEARLSALGLELQPAKAPVANYLGSKRSGNLLFVSGRVSQLRGEVGSDVSTSEAKAAAQSALLDILSIVKEDIRDLDRIESVEKVQGFVRSASDFNEQPEVIDGASDLLIELFGEAGRHARTATGVAQLPFGACVQVELILRLSKRD
jgi:enamine deaminase RidA (YjgF/YER057c/UK114 family)